MAPPPPIAADSGQNDTRALQTTLGVPMRNLSYGVASSHTPVIAIPGMTAQQADAYIEQVLIPARDRLNIPRTQLSFGQGGQAVFAGSTTASEVLFTNLTPEALATLNAHAAELQQATQQFLRSNGLAAAATVAPVQTAEDAAEVAPARMNAVALAQRGALARTTAALLDLRDGPPEERERAASTAVRNLNEMFRGQPSTELPEDLNLRVGTQLVSFTHGPASSESVLQSLFVQLRIPRELQAYAQDATRREAGASEPPARDGEPPARDGEPPAPGDEAPPRDGGRTTPRRTTTAPQMPAEFTAAAGRISGAVADHDAALRTFINETRDTHNERNLSAGANLSHEQLQTAALNAAMLRSLDPRTRTELASATASLQSAGVQAPPSGRDEPPQETSVAPRAVPTTRSPVTETGRAER